MKTDTRHSSDLVVIGTIVLLTIATSTPVLSQTPAPPEYTSNSLDQIHARYTNITYGYVLHSKCGNQSREFSQRFELYMLMASDAFQKHLISKGIVGDKAQADNYTINLLMTEAKKVRNHKCIKSDNKIIVEMFDLAHGFSDFVAQAGRPPR